MYGDNFATDIYVGVKNLAEKEGDWAHLEVKAPLGRIQPTELDVNE